jgi:predicted neutral ceramidase superfamily lipid hydrolase
MLQALLVGIVLMASLVAALFFLKFWRTTRDQLFLAFAVAFALEGSTRVYTLFSCSPDGVPVIYLTRLIAYTLIIVAIARKNRKTPQ